MKEKPKDIKQYKVYRNKLTHIKEQSKKLIKENFIDSKHNFKLLWNTINDIIKFKNKQEESIKEIVNNKDISF